MLAAGVDQLVYRCEQACVRIQKEYKFRIGRPHALIYSRREALIFGIGDHANAGLDLPERFIAGGVIDHDGGERRGHFSERVEANPDHAGGVVSNNYGGSSQKYALQ